MASLEEIREIRLKKLKLLEEAGMDCFPSKVPRDMCLRDTKANFEAFEKANKEVNVAGRVMAIRGQGAIIFAVLDDGKDKLQAVFKKDDMPEDLFKLFTDGVDVGDFVSVTGPLFVTQRGEQSILAKKWTMASKSLAPLPEKWHGLQDIDERFRKRYLDFIMNPELRDLFFKKAKFWEVTRRILKEEGFLEVETPTLETTTGGAEATPFKTHHNDFDLDVYLRISIGELWQKRLMAGGFQRTFEIGRAYRNEGSSPDHLQEFTNFEFYAAWMDYNQGMALSEKMMKAVAEEVFGKTEFTTRGHTFDLKNEWKKLDYVTTVREMTGIDVLAASEDEMKAKLKELKVKFDGENKERLTDTLWKYCRKQISGPAWLINHPKLVSPLSKAKKDNPLLTERFQLILAGAEVCNGFSELNDPVDQKQRFDLQNKLIEAGDSEAMMPDHEFVEMLEHGMPPACGFAYGDRLFAFFVDKTAREIQMFPLMRPKDQEVAKVKEGKIAVALIDESLNLKDWEKLNTAAHLAASLGAHVGRSLLMQDKISTKDGNKINLNIQHAIMMKNVASQKELLSVLQEAKAAGLEVEEFTREMISTTNDKKVIAATLQKNYDEIERLGILIFGPKSVVEGLTKDFKLA
ncbi:MAG: lysine--tRNA ligase [Patescibacteria group bacterium]